MGLVAIVIFKIALYFRQKEEDQARVAKFLEDYRAEKPARFTYADLKRITGGFKEKLGEGAHGAVFRGKLSNEILVAVKILNNTEGEGTKMSNLSILFSIVTVAYNNGINLKILVSH